MIDRSKPLTGQTPGDLRALIDALQGNRERYDRANRIVEARSCELEIADATRALAIINRRATEAEDQRAAEERATIRQAVIDICEDKLDRIGFHSGGSFGVEYDSDDKFKLIGEIADAIAVSIGIPPRAQREADLREAWMTGHRETVRHSGVTDGGCGPSLMTPSESDAEEWAAEYARSKAGE